MEQVISFLVEYRLVTGALIASIAGLVSLAINHRLNTFAREVVAAVYRVSIRAANELQEEGIAWLRSEEGIAYRKMLARAAYASLPERLGPVPVGLVRKLITEDQFCALVESAFQSIVELADNLELPPELPE